MIRKYCNSCPVCSASIERGFGIKAKFQCNSCNTYLEVERDQAWKTVGIIEIFAMLIVSFVSFPLAIVIAMIAVLIGIVVFCRQSLHLPLYVKQKSFDR